MEYNPFVFVLGSPRSGTALIRNMLAVGQDNIGGSRRESGLYSKYNKLPFELIHYKKSPFFNDFLNTEEIEHIFNQSNHPIDFFKKAALHYLHRENKKYFIEKTPYHTFHWQEIIKDFDNPKIIHVQRTPAAIIHSMTTAPWGGLVSERLGATLGEIKTFKYLSAIYKYRKYSSQFKAIQNLPNALTLRYEDIVLKKINVKEVLEDWLDIGLNDFYVSRPYSGEVQHRNKGFDPERVFAYKKNMPRWAQKMADSLFD